MLSSASLRNKIRRYTVSLHSERGLSLIEMVLAMIVLLMVLPLAFIMFSYASQAFEAGDEQADLQQNLRLLADYIREELKYADKVEIIAASDWEQGYQYIYVSEGKAVYLYESQPGSWEERQLYAEITAKITIAELTFNQGAVADNASILSFTIKGTRQGREVTLDATTRLLNTSYDTTHEGVVVKYQSPAPPPGEIRSIETLGSKGEEQRRHYQGNNVSITVVVHTEHIEDGAGATAYLQVMGPDGEDYFAQVMPSSGAPVVDNKAEFTFDFLPDNPSGTYKMEAEVVLEGDSATMARLYWMIPVLDDLVALSDGTVDFHPETAVYEGIIVGPDVGAIEVTAHLYDAADTLIIAGQLVDSGSPESIQLGPEGSETHIRLEVISSDESIANEYQLVVYRQKGAYIDPTSASFDLNAPDDVTTTIIWNDAEKVENVTGGAIEDENWTVVGYTLTIKHEFLAGFDDGDQLTFTVQFDAGEAVLTVEVLDTEG